MEKRVREIVLKAMRQAISKTVAIAEIIKKRIPMLHQDISISSTSITDVWAASKPPRRSPLPTAIDIHFLVVAMMPPPQHFSKGCLHCSGNGSSGRTTAREASRALSLSLSLFAPMVVSPKANLMFLSKAKSPSSPYISVTMDLGSHIVAKATNAALNTQKTEDRIKQMLSNLELSISSYDTAWVAMVPSPDSAQYPCFPECLEWLLNNQHSDGSWSPHCHPMLIKDSLSSTLASVLALKRWNVAEETMKRGLHYIEANSGFVNDEKQQSTIGFDIIFAGMIDYAKELGLNLPLSLTLVDELRHRRDLEIKRKQLMGGKVYLAYLSEGLGKSQDWKEVMKYQRRNGSLFNSPSTTAAAVSHLHDNKCLDYLHSLLKRSGSAVPAAFPLDIYTHLRMVDILEKLGIARHFKAEIKTVLDETLRCWLQGDEEIFLDSSTCAMAFRLLRMNGYNISSDALAPFAEEDLFFNSLGGHISDLSTILELFRASEILTFPSDLVLEKLNSWCTCFLKQKLKGGTHVNKLSIETFQEVDYTLRFPYYANLQRLENRRYIEQSSLGDLLILKTAYRGHNIDNDILQFAVQDFNICQSNHFKELKNLERWVKESRIDQLKFARQKLTYCYFSAAATLFPPELSDARMSWAQNGVLTTVVDDFFDVGGSREELVNLIKLVEQWDGNLASDCCSEQVEIIFFALYNTINELGAKAFAWQGHNVIHHIIEIWLCLLKSMMREADWVRDKLVPTMKEYMSNGYVSFALGPIILPALYFVGPKLSEEIVRDQEYHHLYKLTSTCGRLLNDIQSFKREGQEGKLNSVTLQMVHGSDSSTEEEIVTELKGVIDESRRELLRLVVQTEGSVVPRACKDLFWNMSKILHLFYMRNDGFSSPKEMVSAVTAVIHEPLSPPSVLNKVH